MSNLSRQKILRIIVLNINGKVSVIFGACLSFHNEFMNEKESKIAITNIASPKIPNLNVEK
jgi:hypothetical protein